MKKTFVSTHSGIILLLLFFFFQYHPALAQNELSDSQVQERLQVIHQMLEQGKPNANRWWYGWLIGYSAATIGTVLSNIMRDFKRYTSIEIAKQLETDNEKLFLYIFEKAAEGRKKEQKYKIWQDEYHPKAIYTEEFLLQKTKYIHNNPVRKGLILKPEYWRYSSALTWLNDEENENKINKDYLFQD